MFQDRFEIKILLASAAAYCTATIGWWLQPSLIYEVMQRFNAGESAGGLVASVEIAMVAVSSTVFGNLIGKISLKQITMLGVSVALTGSVISVVVNNYELLLMARALTGFGEGAMLAVASASLANFRDPDRAYGVINIASIVICSAVVFSLPLTSGYFDLEYNVFPTILFSIVVLSLFVFLSGVKQRDFEQSSVNAPPHGIFSWKLQSLLIAVFIIAGGAGAMWSFYYPLGEMAGLDEDEIHNVVGIAALLSVFGALTATLLSSRFGRLIPIILGTLTITVAVNMMCHWHHPYTFMVGAILNVMGMYFLLPYFLGYAAAQDSSGRDAAITAGVFLLTGAAGPYLGGYMIENHGPAVMGILVALANLFVCTLFLGVSKRLSSVASQAIAEPT